ncbi:hypothetical protein TNCV_4350631 [Trichonephila clavipes]|nr:hypothetical protein TNCV_4350631 [Trichonephila clavipes]
MITNFFIPELNNHDVQELWFQQDGATCHTARAKIDLLKDTFGDRLISRFGPVNWPPRSCDLTPLDYFLWGYVKSLVYADKPQTLDHLEDNIRRVIADIRPQMLEKVIENWTTSEPAVAVLCQKSYLKWLPLACWGNLKRGASSGVVLVTSSRFKCTRTVTTSPRVAFVVILDQQRCSLLFSSVYSIPVCLVNKRLSLHPTGRIIVVATTSDRHLCPEIFDSTMSSFPLKSKSRASIKSGIVPVNIFLLQRFTDFFTSPHFTAHTLHSGGVLSANDNQKEHERVRGMIGSHERKPDWKYRLSWKSASWWITTHPLAPATLELLRGPVLNLHGNLLPPTSRMLLEAKDVSR